MIRIAICDDNEIQLEITHAVLADFIATRHEDIAIFDFTSGKALTDAIRADGFFDIYILDVIMPGMNGLELATTLRMLNDEGKIIFLTSSLEYAVQSYDVQASHYLIKPIDREKFYRVISSLLNKISSTTTHVIEVKTASGIVPLHLRNIAFVSTENRVPVYSLTNGRIVTGLTMRHKFREEMATLLAMPNFVECGVSRVVNLACIDSMDSESLMMCDGSVLYPPRQAVNTLMSQWLSYQRRA